MILSNDTILNYKSVNNKLVLWLNKHAQTYEKQSNKFLHVTSMNWERLVTKTDRQNRKIPCEEQFHTQREESEAQRKVKQNRI